MSSKMAYSYPPAVIPMSNPAAKWIYRNKRLLKKVDTLLNEKVVKQRARMTNLHTSWQAGVYEPLSALIREKLSVSKGELWHSRLKHYQVYLDYCADPHAVLSLNQLSDNYDPYCVTRDRDLTVNFKPLWDPVNLAARERSEERLLNHPDWFLFPEKSQSNEKKS